MSRAQCTEKTEHEALLFEVRAGPAVGRPGLDSVPVELHHAGKTKSELAGVVEPPSIGMAYVEDADVEGAPEVIMSGPRKNTAAVVTEGQQLDWEGVVVHM